MATDLALIGLNAVIQNLNNFKSAADSISKSYLDMAKNADLVESSSSGLSGALNSVSTILTGVLIGAAAAALAAVVALAAGFVGLSMTALDVAQDMESASNAIIIGTGASGEALENMEGIVKNLSESSAGVGHSYEMMGKTVAEINTRLGLTGEELESASESALKFARVTGGDAVKSTQLATRVMGDWGIESNQLGSTLDTLFGASQAFGISTDALAQKVVQFGAPLRQMGFTLEESVALFGKWEKEGVNAELAIGSLRIAAGKFAKEQGEMNEEVTGGVKSMADSEQKLKDLKDQLNLTLLKQSEWNEKTKESTKVQGEMKVDKLTREISELEAAMAKGEIRTISTAKEQKSLQQSLFDTFDRIKNAKDETEALSIGMEVFGARAGPDMTAAIREGRFELESAIEALQGTTGGLEDAADRTLTFGDQMGIMWNKVRNSLLPFGDAMLEVAEDIIPILEDTLAKLQPNIEVLAAVLGNTFRNVATTVLPIIQTIFEKGSTFIERFFASFQQGVALGIDPLSNAFRALSNAFGTTFSLQDDSWIFPIIDGTKNAAIWIRDTLIPALIEFGKWIWNEGIPAIIEFGTWFKDNVIPVILDVADVIKNDVIPAISDFVSWITDDLVPALKDIYEWVDDNILPVFEDLFKLFSKDGKKAGGIMSDIWEDISKRLEPFIEDILPELLKIWNEILAWTKRNWPKIQTIIIVTMLAIEKKIDVVLSWIKKFWEKWGKTILDVTESTFGFIWRSIKRALDLIMNGVELFLNVLTGDWKGAWQNILKITETVNNQIKDLISTTWNNIKSIIATALQQVISDVGTKLAQLKSNIDAKFNEIKNSISNIWNSIKNAVVSAVNSMMQGIINSINSFASRISSTLSSVISNAVSSLLSNITSGSIYQTLIAIGKKIIDVITVAFTTVGNIAEKLRTAISNGVQALIANFGTLSTKLTELATNIMNRIGANIALAYSTIRTKLSEAISSAVSGLWDGATALINSIKSIGSTIVTNIGSAISSNFYKIKDKLKDVVKELVKEALSWLGINSPSSLMYDMGINMAQGLTLGLQDGSSLISNGLGNLVSAPLMPAPISSGSAASQAISNQTFNLGGNTIANSMDAATFEARVMDVIRRNV